MDDKQVLLCKSVEQLGTGPQTYFVLSGPSSHSPLAKESRLAVRSFSAQARLAVLSTFRPLGSAFSAVPL